MRRLLPGLVAAALLVAPTAACRSKPADEQTLRDLGVTSSTAAATSTSGSTPRPEEDGPPTTRRSTTTSSAKGTTTTGASDLTELTGDVAAACDALRTVPELDQQLRRARPTSLEDIKANLRRFMAPTLDAYDRAVAAVGADTPVGRELQTLRGATDELYQAYLQAATLEQASDVPLDQAKATGRAAGATFALNDAVKASCGFPLSSQLG